MLLQLLSSRCRHDEKKGGAGGDLVKPVIKKNTQGRQSWPLAERCSRFFNGDVRGH